MRVRRVQIVCENTVAEVFNQVMMRQGYGSSYLSVPTVVLGSSSEEPTHQSCEVWCDLAEYCAIQVALNSPKVMAPVPPVVRVEQYSQHEVRQYMPPKLDKFLMVNSYQVFKSEQASK